MEPISPIFAVWEGKPRSGHWPTIRAHHLSRNPFCVCCGQKNNLTVHHVKPVSISPELELEPENLRTVCNECHFVIGHLGNWRWINSHFDIDAAAHLARVDEFRASIPVEESQR